MSSLNGTLETNLTKTFGGKSGWRPSQVSEEPFLQERVGKTSKRMFKGMFKEISSKVSSSDGFRRERRAEDAVRLSQLPEFEFRTSSVLEDFFKA